MTMKPYKQTPLSKLPELLPLAIASGRTPLLLGAPGIGKTEIVKQWAEKNGYAVVVELLSTMTLDAIRGYAIIDQKSSPPRSIPTMPEVISRMHRAKAENPDKKVLVVFDEITNAVPTVQNSMLTLIQDREMIGFKVPEDTQFVCMGNRSQDNAHVYNIVGPLLNRFAIYSVNPELKAWQTYALNKGAHPMIVAAVENESKHFYTEDASAHKDSMGQFPSPRAWMAVSDILKYCEQDGIDVDNRLLKNTITGLVGTAAATAVQAQIQIGRNLASISQILNSPKKAKVPESQKIKNLVMQTMICASGAINLDYSSDDKSWEKATDSIVEYMRRMPSQYQMVFVNRMNDVDIEKSNKFLNRHYQFIRDASNVVKQVHG